MATRSGLTNQQMQARPRVVISTHPQLRHIEWRRLRFQIVLVNCSTGAQERDHVYRSN